MVQGPLGDRVGQLARKVESREGVEALYAAYRLSSGASDAGDPGAVAGEVFGVDLIDLLRPNLFLRRADAA